MGGLAVFGVSVAIVLRVLLKRSRRKQLEEVERFEVMEPAPNPHQRSTLTAYSRNAPIRSIHKFETQLSQSLSVLPGRTHQTTTFPDTASQTSLGSRMWSSGRNSLSTTEVVGLRTEVENLRRVMQEFQAQRSEPLPEYSE